MNEGSVVQYPCLEGRGSAMETLYMAFANVCSLFIATVALMQFGRNVLCKFWRCFGRTGVGGRR